MLVLVWNENASNAGEWRQDHWAHKRLEDIIRNKIRRWVWILDENPFFGQMSYFHALPVEFRISCLWVRTINRKMSNKHWARNMNEAIVYERNYEKKKMFPNFYDSKVFFSHLKPC